MNALKPTKRSRLSKSKYLQRLAEVNNIETKTVFDCIDKPLRRLCFEFNRAGFQTHFCCCGFEYENQEEPKTHIKDKTGIYGYVMFSVLNNSNAISNLLSLQTYCINNNFAKFSIPHLSSVMCLALSSDGVNFGYKSDQHLSLHDYEFILAGSELLAKHMQDNFATINDPVIFKDGNKMWNYENWQIKAKQDFEISVVDFYNKYGKLATLNFMNDPKFAKFDMTQSDRNKLVNVNQLQMMYV